jgi:hypothetical protein
MKNAIYTNDWSSTRDTETVNWNEEISYIPPPFIPSCRTVSTILAALALISSHCRSRSRAACRSFSFCSSLILSLSLFCFSSSACFANCSARVTGACFANCSARVTGRLARGDGSAFVAGGAAIDAELDGGVALGVIGVPLVRGRLWLELGVCAYEWTGGRLAG